MSQAKGQAKGKGGKDQAKRTDQAKGKGKQHEDPECMHGSINFKLMPWVLSVFKFMPMYFTTGPHVLHTLCVRMYVTMPTCHSKDSDGPDGHAHEQ